MRQQLDYEFDLYLTQAVLIFGLLASMSSDGAAADLSLASWGSHKIHLD